MAASSTRKRDPRHLPPRAKPDSPELVLARYGIGSNGKFTAEVNSRSGVPGAEPRPWFYYSEIKNARAQPVAQVNSDAYFLAGRAMQRADARGGGRKTGRAKRGRRGRAIDVQRDHVMRMVLGIARWCAGISAVRNDQVVAREAADLTAALIYVRDPEARGVWKTVKDTWRKRAARIQKQLARSPRR